MARVARDQAVLSLRPKHRIDIERAISLPNLVKSLSMLQLEEEVREVLRGRKLREARNHFRIKFREEERGRKIVEEDERRKEKEDEEREREGRMEGLRRVARRRLGLHLMPRDVRWVQAEQRPTLHRPSLQSDFPRHRSNLRFDRPVE